MTRVQFCGLAKENGILKENGCMKEQLVGINDGTAVRQVLKVTETLQTLELVCAPGAQMGKAVYRDNLRGIESITHDGTPKIVTEQRFSLHKSDNNPAINNIGFHLQHDQGGKKLHHVLNTTAIKQHGAFVPIYCERYGSLRENLRILPSAQDSVTLGPVDFGSSIFFYGVFAGPTGRKFSHCSQRWHYENIQRSLFDLHILWVTVRKKNPGSGVLNYDHAFMGFQPAVHWGQDLDLTMKEALQKPLDDTGIVHVMLSAAKTLFEFK